MPANASKVSRRDFLTGRKLQARTGIRPPWTDDAHVRDWCSECGKCVTDCPEAILVLDEDNRPRVELNGGECSFCGLCAAACETNVFDLARTPPWEVTAVLAEGCLMDLGISCRLCTDTCDKAALVFDLSVRPVGAIRVDKRACTGCGACISVCPADALTLFDPRLEAAR